TRKAIRASSGSVAGTRRCQRPSAYGSRAGATGSPVCFRSIGQGNVLIPVVGGQVETTIAPVRGAPFRLGELDALLRRGDEVPPDVAWSVECRTAEDH